MALKENIFWNLVKFLQLAVLCQKQDVVVTGSYRKN